MKPIYKPKGKAKEYGDYAINIYTGCPHQCFYCFAPGVLRREKETFHSMVEPRKNIVEEVKRQLESDRMVGERIHLCFTCDPYPLGADTEPTREIIRAIKESGNCVQILTKGGREAERDFDLLDSNDWFGVTYSGFPEGFPGGRSEAEPNAAAPLERLATLQQAFESGIKTWVSCEPVLDQDDIYSLIKVGWYINRFKIGKLNYHPSDIDWSLFGAECERLCKKYERDYYIKESLRLEMNTGR
jgi:DNA repair photolyase